MALNFLKKVKPVKNAEELAFLKLHFKVIFKLLFRTKFQKLSIQMPLKNRWPKKFKTLKLFTKATRVMDAKHLQLRVLDTDALREKTMTSVSSARWRWLQSCRILCGRSENQNIWHSASCVNILLKIKFNLSKSPKKFLSLKFLKIWRNLLFQLQNTKKSSTCSNLKTWNSSQKWRRKCPNSWTWVLWISIPIWLLFLKLLDSWMLLAPSSWRKMRELKNDEKKFCISLDYFTT